MRIKRLLTGAFVLAAAMVLPAQASAVTTIGANLALPYTADLNCNAVPTGCTGSNGPTISGGAVASGGLSSPISGVIVRWRIKTGALTMPTTLHVLRPGPSTSRIGAGRSAVVTPAPSMTSTFETRLPIARDDTVGVDTKVPPYSALAGAPGLYWNPALGDGGSAVAAAPFNNNVFLVNADVEADNDGDGYGDESQDQCPSDGTTHGPCFRGLTVIPPERGGTVTGPGIDCPGDCSEKLPLGTTIDLKANPKKGWAVDRRTWAPPCVEPKIDVCSLVINDITTVSAEFDDRRQPQTTITKAPKKRSTKRNITIKYTVSWHVMFFECALDSKKFEECRAPFRATVGVGKHVFLIRAVAKHDVVEKTPAKVTFRVLP